MNIFKDPILETIEQLQKRIEYLENAVAKLLNKDQPVLNLKEIKE